MVVNFISPKSPDPSGWTYGIALRSKCYPNLLELDFTVHEGRALRALGLASDFLKSPSVRRIVGIKVASSGRTWCVHP